MIKRSLMNSLRKRAPSIVSYDLGPGIRRDERVLDQLKLIVL